MDVLQALAEGTVSFPDALASPHATFLTLGELVEALPGYGAKRARKTLAEKANIAPWLEVRHVTHEQAERVLAVL